LQGVPLYEALGGAPAGPLITDITLSISDPPRMAAAAIRYGQAGFTCFKVQVGRDWRADCASLRAVAPPCRARGSGWTPTPASPPSRRWRCWTRRWATA
jgi:L-alanine-DL-glutamate epimerase-like enolase superfamily enzyme